MREMLNPKNGLEKKIEDEIESRMGAKGMIAKLERELTERELEEIKELREMVEKELKEGEKEELKKWREKKRELQKKHMRS